MEIGTLFLPTPFQLLHSSVPQDACTQTSSFFNLFLDHSLVFSSVMHSRLIGVLLLAFERIIKNIYIYFHFPYYDINWIPKNNKKILPEQFQSNMILINWFNKRPLNKEYKIVFLMASWYSFYLFFFLTNKRFVKPKGCAVLSYLWVQT